MGLQNNLDVLVETVKPSTDAFAFWHQEIIYKNYCEHIRVFWKNHFLFALL